MNNITTSPSNRFKRAIESAGRANLVSSTIIQTMELLFLQGETKTLNEYFGDSIQTYNIAADLVYNTPFILKQLAEDPNSKPEFKQWFFDKLGIDPETFKLKIQVV